MRSLTKWLSAFLLGMMLSPACRHSGEPVKAGPHLGPDGGTNTQPGDGPSPSVDPDTGAPIGPIAAPRTSQYADGLHADGWFGAVPPSGGGAGSGGAPGGGAPGGGKSGGGGSGLVTGRYLVAL